MLPHLDLKTTERLLDGLGIVLYGAMAIALLTALLGSPGWAFLMLLLGAGALVLRTTLELRS
ncbi:MAG TPA: hypothetical protein VFI17_07535 [Solirubrobacterales bacterium]|nr:hypothetical protein [Solirubrobacterales bacterium]